MREKNWWRKWLWLIEAYFITLALTMEFHIPLTLSMYEEYIDYILAQMGELLGSYEFTNLLIFLLVAGCLWGLNRSVLKEKTGEKVKLSEWVLPLFFSFCYLIGNSYAQTNSWDYCFGSLVNFIKFLTAMAGFTFLLRYVLIFLEKALEFLAEYEWKGMLQGFFSKNCFRHVCVLLLLLWLPVILLSYPGNLCWDGIGQIEQVIGNGGYLAHHPLLSTLLMGGLTWLGKALFSSFGAGTFLYILIQAVLLAAALAGTVDLLQKRKTSTGMLTLVTGIYCLSPMYSNLVTTVIKDVPFLAFVIWYLVFLVQLLEKKELLKNVKFMGLFLGVQLLVMLLRNNGAYMVLLTGVICGCLWWKELTKKCRGLVFLWMVFLPLLLWKGTDGILMASLDAKEGSIREMLSLPMQQTARYLQLYQDEITEEERDAIEDVLGEVEQIAASYDPDLADPVKAHFRVESTMSEVGNYLRAWSYGLMKHPDVYVQAGFAHVYGWFHPGVSNAVRYEAEYGVIPQKGLIPKAEKVIIFAYRLLERFTPVNALQNPGIYTWLLFFLCGYVLRKRKEYMGALVPLLISLLICMLSPCFYLHPRYAYPIMFTLPFLIAVITGRKKEREQNE